jgi:nicotinamidase-related amidase
MKTALLIIDVQKDYFPGGAMELSGSLEAAARIVKVLARFRDRKEPVVHVQHIAVRPGSTFFIPGTSGVDIHESVLPGPGEPLVRKHFPNAFRDTELNAILAEGGIDHLVVVGMMTHMCVDTTDRAAFDLGYGCTILSDCCATRSLGLKDMTIGASSVQNSFLAALDGTFGRVMSSEAYLGGKNQD